MKKFVVITVLIISPAFIYSQYYWNINFEDWSYGEERIHIDTVSNPDNIWQIGQPSKTLFNEAFSNPNAIVTDTLNYYPNNDTSSFIIKHRREMGQHAHTIILAFRYKMNSDTIADYGKVETSFDEGIIWIDLLDDDNIDYYGIYWDYPKPVFSGNINEWKSTSVWLGNLDYHFEYNDTILYRFTFISDNLDNQKEGWMIDNIFLEDWFEGIDNINPSFISTVYPNPVNNKSILKFENESHETNVIEIFMLTGKLIETRQTNSNTVEIANRKYRKGIYFYRIRSTKGNSYGKFIVN